MANRVTMNICGEEYTLVAEETSSYMEKIGSIVDEKMRELMDSARVSRNDAAVLAAVNLADELCKAQEGTENLRRQLKNYLDEANAAKNEISELKRQLFKYQQQQQQQNINRGVTTYNNNSGNTGSNGTFHRG